MKTAENQAANVGVLVENSAPDDTGCLATATEQLPRGTGVAYAMGTIPCQVFDHAITYLVNPLYNVVLGVNPALIGTMMTAVRLLDFVLDPFVANFSDNSHSRWGRRKPIWLGGGILTVLSFSAFFFVPTGWSASTYSVYLIAVLICFEIGRSPMTIAYLSMLPELSSDTRTRTAVLGVALQIGAWATFATVWALPFAQSALFGNIMTGLKVFAGALACFGLAAIVAVTLRVRERFVHLVAKQERIPLLTSLREIAKMKPLVKLLVGTVLFGLAGNVVNSLGFYILVYYVSAGSIAKGAFWQSVVGSAGLGSVILLSPLVLKWCRRFGHERVFVACAVSIICSSLSKPVCFFPGASWSVFVPTLLVAVPWQIVNVILKAKAADLTDWDELETGHRREGMISMAIGWANKAILSFVFAGAGFLLVASGFDASRGGAQGPDVFSSLLTWYVCIPITFVLLGLLILNRYPITQERALEIRVELERRRGRI